MVPARRKDQKSILFGIVEVRSMTRESSKNDNEFPQFSHYESNQNDGEHGVRPNKGPGLNFGKGRRTLLWSFVPKGKTPDWGLGYVSTPIPSASEESLCHDYSSVTSSWESDVSVSNIFREFSVNIVSASHLEDRDEETTQFDTDPWIKHLNALWDTRFEQREPPTEDKVVQINLGVRLILSPSS